MLNLNHIENSNFQWLKLSFSVGINVNRRIMHFPKAIPSTPIYICSSDGSWSWVPIMIFTTVLHNLQIIYTSQNGNWEYLYK